MEFLLGTASASAGRITAGFRLTPVGSTIGASVNGTAEADSLRHFHSPDKRLVLRYAAHVLDPSASCSSLERYPTKLNQFDGGESANVVRGGETEGRPAGI